MYYSLSGRNPFFVSGVYNPQNHINCKIDFEVQVNGANPFDYVKPAVKDLILRMLSKDPKNRPSIEDLLNHPWIQENQCNQKSPLESKIYLQTQISKRICFDETIP